MPIAKTSVNIDIYMKYLCCGNIFHAPIQFYRSFFANDAKTIAQLLLCKYELLDLHTLKISRAAGDKQWYRYIPRVFDREGQTSILALHVARGVRNLKNCLRTSVTSDIYLRPYANVSHPPSNHLVPFLTPFPFHSHLFSPQVTTFCISTRALRWILYPLRWCRYPLTDHLSLPSPNYYQLTPRINLRRILWFPNYYTSPTLESGQPIQERIVPTRILQPGRMP